MKQTLRPQLLNLVALLATTAVAATGCVRPVARAANPKDGIASPPVPVGDTTATNIVPDGRSANRPPASPDPVARARKAVFERRPKDALRILSSVTHGPPPEFSEGYFQEVLAQAYYVDGEEERAYRSLRGYADGLLGQRSKEAESLKGRPLMLPLLFVLAEDAGDAAYASRLREIFLASGGSRVGNDRGWRRMSFAEALRHAAGQACSILVAARLEKRAYDLDPNWQTAADYISSLRQLKQYDAALGVANEIKDKLTDRMEHRAMEESARSSAYRLKMGHTRPDPQARRVLRLPASPARP